MSGLRIFTTFLAALAVSTTCVFAALAQPHGATPFANPQPVRILGYDGDAMEPFLSRDGAILFFNNRNAPAERTDLYWAERVDDLTFRFRGPVAGANAAGALDGVATMSAAGRFCFVSTRSYGQTLTTLHCSDWTGAGVTDVTAQRRAAPAIPGRVAFDVEIDAAGDTLIFADGLFRGGPVPAVADLRLARREGSGFVLSPKDDALFAAINTPDLEYAAALSADGLELSFTRMKGFWIFAGAEIFIARRPRTDAPFGAVERLDAVTGFAEAATFSPDARALYLHRRIRNRFGIWRVTRD